MTLRQAQDRRIGEAIAAEAETWIDTRFLWQGRVKGHGCDCKGLVAGVAAACGRPEADSVEALAGDYSDRRKVDSRRLRAGLARLFDQVPLADRRAGDVLLIRLRRVPQHLAIAAPREGKPARVIEALLDAGKVRPFRRHDAEIDSVWRWREVTPCL
jgi:cell wall-associated NlpC family hydrolase